MTAREVASGASRARRLTLPHLAVRTMSQEFFSFHLLSPQILVSIVVGLSSSM